VNAPPRYVRRDTRIYEDSHCILCGSNYGICLGEPRACKVMRCLACGSEQCSVNGLARGQCGICRVGLLSGWSGSDRLCNYRGCREPAVARVDGQCPVRCKGHLERGKWYGYVMNALLERGAGWILTEPRDVPMR
jgi:hypothetical protein